MNPAINKDLQIDLKSTSLEHRKNYGSKPSGVTNRLSSIQELNN